MLYRMLQPNFEDLLTVELPGAMNFQHITPKLFRTSQLLPIDTLPAHYPRGSATACAPSGYHPSHTRRTLYSGDITAANCQHASVSTSFIWIGTWILTVFYVEASKTMNTFYGLACSKKKPGHALQIVFYNLLRDLSINLWPEALLHLYKCFQKYVLMVKQSLPIRSGLSDDAIGVLYLMVIPSGPMKLLHEQHKQSNVYMTKTPIESAKIHLAQVNATFILFHASMFFINFSNKYKPTGGT
jgi:hypothetical protein